jgi:hypothetical protein
MVMLTESNRRSFDYVWRVGAKLAQDDNDLRIVAGRP